MSDREELHKLHVDQFGPGGERQCIAVAAHIGRGTVAPENPGEPAARDNHRLGGDRHCLARGAVERHRPDDLASRLAVRGDDVGDGEVADPADRIDMPDLAAQGRGDGRAGIEKIDVAAPWHRVPRRGDLGDMPVGAARPADPPLTHLADPRRRPLA